MIRRLLILLVLGAARLAEADTNIPIYVNIVMHVEENPPYNNSSLAYERARTQTVLFARMLYSNNVMFNYQSDWTFLSGTTNYDASGHQETDGTNVVAWMKYTLGFEVDPHAHESTHSYADVAWLLTRCGILTQDLSHVVGGFIAGPPTSSILDHVRHTVTGWVHTAFAWAPEILWGGGTGNHQDETNYWSSGIWRPKSTNEFKTHDPAAPLPCVGNFGTGTQRWVNLARLLDWRQAGLLCSNKMYTCLIMNNQGDLSELYTAAFAAQLQEFKTNANLRWVGIAEAVDIWRNEYGEEPCVLPSDLSLDVDQDGLDDGWETTNNCDITWTDGTADFDGDAQADAEEYTADTDPLDGHNYFGVTALDGSTLTWSSAAGRMYGVEISTNLFGDWVTDHVTNGTGGALSYTGGGTPEEAFYRVRVLSP